MVDRMVTDGEAENINTQMVKQMEERRRQRPERRQRAAPATVERRRICAYCFQPGDHPTPRHCLRALER